MIEDPAPPRPTLRVIRGDATPEDIAAILAVVSARTMQARAREQRTRADGWNDRSAAMRPIPAAGPGAWRASSWSL